MANLTVTRFDIPGPALITPKRHGDDRGWFTQTWSASDWQEVGLPEIHWVQDNEAFSAAAGTLRGMHFQAPPHAQDKLLRCIHGEIYDAIVDIRKGSPTYGKSLGVHLTGKGGEQLLVPAGFAHGYQTLSADTLVAYKVSSPYAPQAEGGLVWNDADAAIDWPNLQNVITAERDATWPGLADLDSPFTYSA